MRKSTILDALLPRTRQQILAQLLLNADHSWYQSQLASRIGTKPSSLQRELAELTAAGLLLRSKDGRRTKYRADTRSPIYSELRSILVKTVGIAEPIRESLRKLEDQILFAFVYGSFATQTEGAPSDIDLLVVGQARLIDISIAMRPLEEEVGRPVNVVLFSWDLFRQKVRAADHFLNSVLGGPRVFIIGDENKLAASA